MSDFYESDLAEERHTADFLDGGILFLEEKHSEVRLTRLTVTSETGARAIERPVGRYLTVSFPRAFLLSPTLCEEGAQRIADALDELLPKHALQILVLGLGNRHLTADSIGPLCADALSEAGLPKGVAVFSPGTMGQTGLPSVKLARAAIAAHGADALVLIDALAGRDRQRLLCAVELCDTGLSPGTGVGNRTDAIRESTVGVPTVAVGIPTMMRGAVLLKNELSRLKISDGGEGAERRLEGLFVVPSSLDEDIKEMTRLITYAFSLFFVKRYQNLNGTERKKER